MFTMLQSVSDIHVYDCSITNGESDSEILCGMPIFEAVLPFKTSSHKEWISHNCSFETEG